MSRKEIIDGKILTLDEWLKIVLLPESKRKCRIIDCQFATDEHLEQYIENIGDRNNEEINTLLENFLIPCGHLGSDKSIRERLFALNEEEFEKKINDHSYYKRLINLESHPWQGITWIIDLLPFFPQEAINGLGAYFLAHCQLLPDARLQGFSDSETLIRKKYLEHKLPVKDTLLNLTPRDFELLIAHLYKKKGYDIKITPRTRDGGFDIVAWKLNDRESEKLHIECKRYAEKLGVNIVRGVLGTLVVQKATKAVLVTSSDFTRSARREAMASNRLELVSLSDIDADMRQYESANWTTHISRYLIEIKRSEKC